MEIRRLNRDDRVAVLAAQDLFDGPADQAATKRFLSARNHDLLVAYHDERPVGFVSSVEVTHPDRCTEMFLYELAVDETVRRQGIGRALVAALLALARGRGCYGMFVFADEKTSPRSRPTPAPAPTRPSARSCSSGTSGQRPQETPDRLALCTSAASGGT